MFSTIVYSEHCCCQYPISGKRLKRTFCRIPLPSEDVEIIFIKDKQDFGFIIFSGYNEINKNVGQREGQYIFRKIF